MENRELTVPVLKQARNLRGKTIMGNQNIFLSDDSTPSVQEVRKKLLAIRTSIREKTGFFYCEIHTTISMYSSP